MSAEELSPEEQAALNAKVLLENTTPEGRGALATLYGANAYKDLLAQAQKAGHVRQPVDDTPTVTRRDLMANKRRYSEQFAAWRKQGKNPREEFAKLPKE